MKSKKETFGSLLDSFGYRYNIREVFDDFLTLTLCAFAQNPQTRKSYYEDEYLATIQKYKHDRTCDVFPKMLGALVCEMEDRVDSDTGNDLLGEYYEQHLYRKGASQYFTPWPVCMFIARTTSGTNPEGGQQKRILDPTCGSGRMLLAGSKSFGRQHRYYGIDIDHTCVKMAAITLFLNGVFGGEIMCANALDRNDFRVSYKLSFLPFGIFRIEEKEHSLLWDIYHNAMAKSPSSSPNVQLPSESGDASMDQGSQLTLF
ncbi:N-6 DNA methylase [bacterium]|nr:N-6 DNA methylase [bacterium]